MDTMYPITNVISDNEINFEGLQLFFNTIKSNENISLIDAHNNTLSNKVKILPEIIGSLTNMITFNLSDLTIGDRNIIKEIFCAGDIPNIKVPLSSPLKNSTTNLNTEYINIYKTKM